MGLFSIFSGKSPEAYEREGDALARDRIWGEAKLAYEAGLDKIARHSTDDPSLAGRLEKKLHQSKEALAEDHHREAMALLDAGCMDEAHELLTLAAELTVDPRLKEELADKIRDTSVQEIPVLPSYDNIYQDPSEDAEDSPLQEDADDYFNLVIGALPDEVQQVYRSYGHNFKLGYIALNQGDFDAAVNSLILAAEENPSPESLVPLELATAYVNLGQVREGQAILEELVQHQPDLLPAYELLCEIYWEDKDFDKAMGLLDSLAPDLAESMVAFQIRGETLLRAARYEEAKSYFETLFETYGWREPLAIGLARSHEGLGQDNQARDVYRTLISQCTGCGSRIDPAIKRKYADLSFAAGDYNTEVLEYYLELTREDPVNAIHYYRTISQIYAEMGNDTESRRFLSFADHLTRNR